MFRHCIDVKGMTGTVCHAMSLGCMRLPANKNWNGEEIVSEAAGVTCKQRFLHLISTVSLPEKFPFMTGPAVPAEVPVRPRGVLNFQFRRSCLNGFLSLTFAFDALAAQWRRPAKHWRQRAAPRSSCGSLARGLRPSGSRTSNSQRM